MPSNLPDVVGGLIVQTFTEVWKRQGSQRASTTVAPPYARADLMRSMLAKVSWMKRTEASMRRRSPRRPSSGVPAVGVPQRPWRAVSELTARRWGLKDAQAQDRVARPNALLVGLAAGRHVPLVSKAPEDEHVPGRKQGGDAVTWRPRRRGLLRSHLQFTRLSLPAPLEACCWRRS